MKYQNFPNDEVHFDSSIRIESDSEMHTVLQSKKKTSSRLTASKKLISRPFKCQLGCNKAYASYSARSYHHKTVHQKIRHRCSMLACGKQYSSIHQLKKHMAKPHDCLIQIINMINWFE